MSEKIVVGVDGHEGGRDALALAGALADPCDAELIAVRVYLRGPHPGRVPRLEDLLRHDAEAELTGELAGRDVEATPVVVGGHTAANALHRVAEQEGAGLIVVGSSRRGGPGRVVAGDVALATLHDAPCAVAVAARGARSRGRAPAVIGVGIAGEPGPEPALDRAVALAQRTGARLRLLTVVALPRDLDIDGYFLEEVLERYRHDTDDLAKRVADRGGIDADGVTLIGTPAEELARFSRAVDLLVLGSQRPASAHRPGVGRTTERLVHDASCNVLVVPTGADAGAGPVAAEAGRTVGTAGALAV